MSVLNGPPPTDSFGKIMGELAVDAGMGILPVILVIAVIAIIIIMFNTGRKSK